MSIVRKLLLAAIALGFAFVITSFKDPNYNRHSLAEFRIKDTQERHHNRW